MRIFFLALLAYCLSSCQSSNRENSKTKTTPPLTSPLQIVYSPQYKISLFGFEKLHPFDIGKYDKIYKHLKKEGFANKSNTHTPSILTEEQLLFCHTEQYLKDLKNSKKVATFLEAPVLRSVPSSIITSNVVNRFKLASGGTLMAAELALTHGYAVNIGGGYHHAKPDKGEGFCLIADVPIAIRQLQKDNKIRRALIIDTDVHQGNGTIVCLENDPSTFTFSMHQGDIYPTPKEDGDLDIELEAHTGDTEYLKILANNLDQIFTSSKPDIVFHVAGCDALTGDPLANLEMTHEGIKKRDLLIAAACHQYQVPYVMTMSGGYSKGAWMAQSGSISALSDWIKSHPIHVK